MAERVLFIGMNNPLSTDHRYALYPNPERCTGWRVWKMMTDYAEAKGHEPIWKAEYVRAIERTNLVIGNWSIRAAREGWMQLRMERDDLSQYGAVLLLGAEVQRIVLGNTRYPILGQADMGKFWCIPHPSGLNRMYNDPGVREEAGEILHRLYQRATA